MGSGPSWIVTAPGSALRLWYQTGCRGEPPCDATSAYSPSCSTRMSGVLRSLPDLFPRVVTTTIDRPLSRNVLARRPPDASYSATCSRTQPYGLGSYSPSSGDMRPSSLDGLSPAEERDQRQPGRGSNGAPGARTTVAVVRVLLNLIWLVFGGLVLALAYAVVALVMFVLIITIPFGLASARIALFCLWPFGRTLVRRPGAGGGSLIGNIIWIVLAGWWLALGHLITGVLMCLTVIGIPLGLANFKLIPVSLTPLGREIVDLDEARRMGLDGAVTVPAEPSRGRP